MVLPMLQSKCLTLGEHMSIASEMYDCGTITLPELINNKTHHAQQFRKHYLRKRRQSFGEREEMVVNVEGRWAISHKMAAAIKC